MPEIKNKIQLITYPNSLGGNLKGLHTVLAEYFKEAVAGVHILPFYPSSKDRGFSPLTNFEVDPAFGNWDDIRSIAKEFDLVSDLVVNHISSESKPFKDFLQKGENSEYADWFITSEKFSRHIRGKRRKTFGKGLLFLEGIMNSVRKHDVIFHRQGVNIFILKKIFRPRPGSPFIEYKFADGTSREVWCTFSDNQIDLDVDNEDVRKMLEESIKMLADSGTKLLRLDAVGYTVKKRGTHNFMIPKAYKFIQWLASVAHEHGVSVLPEIHHHYTMQFKLAKTDGVDYVYDFALPMLMLRAIYSSNTKSLKNWIKIRPHNQITTLDTHDGIGVIDVDGLMSKGEIDNTVNRLREYGGNATMRATGMDPDNVDVYQQNITCYSALGENDGQYLLARAVQFFIPGIPQIYYVGLLAGKNDEKRFKETGIGREIMRHNYNFDEVEWYYKQDIVQELIKLMKFRNSHEAFNGDFSMKNTDDKQLTLRWEKGQAFCELRADFEKCSAVIEYSDQKTGNVEFYEVC